MSIDFLREALWLKSRTRGYLMLFAAFNVATLAFLVLTSREGVDRNGFLLGTDFLSFWTTGRMLHGGGAVYDQAAHIAAQSAYFVQQDGAFTAFFYPPSFLPFCWPLGLAGYFPALAAWLLATGALYVVAVTAWRRQQQATQISRWLLLAAFPPVLLTITHGQTSFLLAGLLGLDALLVPRAPIASGVLFGLATIKPQFGVLVPIALLLTGQWRVIAAAAVTSITLALAASLMFGFEQWSQWAGLGTNVQSTMDGGGVGFAKMMSAFAAARLLGLPILVSYALQAFVSLGVVVALVLVAFRARWSVGIAAVMLAVLIWLAAHKDHMPWERIIIALAFAAPLFARPLAMDAGVPIMPLALVALFALVTRRALSQDSTSVPEGATA